MPKRSTLIEKRKCDCGYWVAFREMADGRLRVEEFVPHCGRASRLRTPRDRARAEALYQKTWDEHLRAEVETSR